MTICWSIETAKTYAREIHLAARYVNSVVSQLYSVKCVLGGGSCRCLFVCVGGGNEAVGVLVL